MSSKYCYEYPPSVYYKRKKILTLKEQTTEESITTQKITAISKKQYEAVMWLGSKRAKIPTWDAEKIQALDEKLATLHVKYNQQTNTVTVKNIDIKMSNILLIGDVMPSKDQRSRYFKSKTIREIKYWYHYGRDWYDYYGCGRNEFKSAWEIIKEIINAEEYYLIYQTVKNYKK